MKCITEKYMIIIKVMNSNSIIKKLYNIKENMPDLIIKKIKVSLFNWCLYYI